MNEQFISSGGLEGGGKKAANAIWLVPAPYIQQWQHQTKAGSKRIYNRYIIVILKTGSKKIIQSLYNCYFQNDQARKALKKDKIFIQDDYIIAKWVS